MTEQKVLPQLLDEMANCGGFMCGHCIEILCEKVIPIAQAIEIPHSCTPIARAVAVDKGRDYWMGRLNAPIAEWPKETHCLHMKTPVKNVIFLCNSGDFEQLLVLSNVLVGLKNLRWLESMTEAVKSAAYPDPLLTRNEADEIVGAIPLQALPGKTEQFTHTQPAEDERVKELTKLADKAAARVQNYAASLGKGFTFEQHKDIEYIIGKVLTDSALSPPPVRPAQQEDDGWVTFGRIKTDIESETETFERIPVQPAASTPTDRVRWLLTQIMWDLPANRDWLDPAIEAEAREVTGVKRAAGLVSAELNEPDIYDAVAELRDAAASTEAQDERKSLDAKAIPG